MSLPIAGDLERLDKLVFTNISSAWSLNMIATRSSQWKRFLTFCINHGLTPLPASPRTIARFLSDMALTCKYTTIVNYLSSITTMHKFYGFEPEFRNSYYLSMAVKGIKVNIGSEIQQKVGLTPRELLQMYLFVSIGDQFESVCWSSIVFSFRTLLRKSNFLPDTSEHAPHLIARKNIQFHQDYMTVLVSTSKTDRSGGKPTKLVIYETTQNPLCAVYWMKLHFNTTPEPKEGIFVKKIKGNYVPLLYRDVLEFLQRLVTFIGLDPHHAGVDSLRRSGASYLNSIGVSLPDIKLMGNWKSNAVFEYIKCSEEQMVSIQKHVASSLTGIQETND